MSQGASNRGMTLSVASLVFVTSLSAFGSIGLVPCYIDRTCAETNTVVQALPDASGNLALASIPRLGGVLPPPTGTQEIEYPLEPTRIVIRSQGIDLQILNPHGTTIKELDDALLSGAVRYPLSAQLNQNGNIFIFGHSSHLPIVKNQMFRAFNKLSSLKEGDTIELHGGGEVHTYRVNVVRKTDASDETIDLSASQGKKLTLSTCDSFGAKTSRYVVEAEFVGKKIQ